MSDGIEWTDEQLKEAKIHKGRLRSLARRLRKCSEDMQALGLEVYGASGTGHLVHHSRPTHTGRECEPDFGSVVANIGFGFNGGDW